MKKLILIFILTFCIASTADAQSGRYFANKDAKYYLSGSTLGFGLVGADMFVLTPIGLGLGYMIDYNLQVSLTGAINSLKVPLYEDEYYYDDEYYTIQGRSIEAAIEKLYPFWFGSGYVELSAGIGYNSYYPYSDLSGIYFPFHFKIGGLFSEHFEWVFIDFMLAFSTARAYDWICKIDFLCFRYRF